MPPRYPPQPNRRYQTPPFNKSMSSPPQPNRRYQTPPFNKSMSSTKPRNGEWRKPDPRRPTGHISRPRGDYAPTRQNHDVRYSKDAKPKWNQNHDVRYSKDAKPKWTENRFHRRMPFKSEPKTYYGQTKRTDRPRTTAKSHFYTRSKYQSQGRSNGENDDRERNSFTDATCSESSSDSSVGSSHVKGKYLKKNDWTKQHSATPGTSEEEKQKYVALDCEMVGIGEEGKESALARISMVDWDHNVLMDTFVRVPEPVTDYRTFVSGVRQSDIDSDEAMNLEDCRLIVQDLIKNKIIVGHALQNDFDALGITHPWYRIRDTTKYKYFLQEDFWVPGVLLPRKLKDLVWERLGVDIQRYGVEHSPLEDACAAMELFKSVRTDWESLMEFKLNKARKVERNMRMAPAKTYGPPSSSAKMYRAPSSSAKMYGVPSSSAKMCGVPSSSAKMYGAPSSSAKMYGAPTSSIQMYGAPSSPVEMYGAPSSSVQMYGAPSSPVDMYGAPPYLLYARCG